MKKKQQVIHIHGGMAFNDYTSYISILEKELEITFDHPKDMSRWSHNYYRYLDQSLYKVLSPDMPSKNNAKYLEWVIWFEKLFPFLQDDVILVGHSLGGGFLAKYLSEYTIPVTITQLHLVAPVYNYEDDIEQLADFKITDFPKNILNNKIHEIHIYHSSDDTIVLIAESHKYYEALPGSHLHIFSDRFHFLDETFPELFKNIQSIENKNPADNS